MKKYEPQKTTQKKLIKQLKKIPSICKFHKNYKEQQFQKYHDLYLTL